MTVHQVVVVLDVNAPDLLTAGRCAVGILNGTRGWYLQDSDSHLESWWMPEEPLRTQVDHNDNPPGQLVLLCEDCDRPRAEWPARDCDSPEQHSEAERVCDCGDTVTVAQAIAQPERHRRCSLIGASR